MKFPSSLQFSTLGPIGRIGFAPGTWGSLVSLILWAPLVIYTPIWIRLLVVVAVFILGYWVIKGDDDAPQIVIDEAAGMGFATLFCAPTSASLAAAFLFFRIFDILKPWPISLADRKIKGPFGIMFDDVLAGILAALAVLFTQT